MGNILDNTMACCQLRLHGVCAPIATITSIAISSISIPWLWLSFSFSFAKIVVSVVWIVSIAIPGIGFWLCNCIGVCFTTFASIPATITSISAISIPWLAFSFWLGKNAGDQDNG